MPTPLTILELCPGIDSNLVIHRVKLEVSNTAAAFIAGCVIGLSTGRTPILQHLRRGLLKEVLRQELTVDGLYGNDLSNRPLSIPNKDITVHRVELEPLLAHIEQDVTSNHQVLHCLMEHSTV